MKLAEVNGVTWVCRSFRKGDYLQCYQLTATNEYGQLAWPSFTSIPQSDLAELTMKKGVLECYSQGSPPLGTRLNKPCTYSICFKGQTSLLSEQCRSQSCQLVQHQSERAKILIPHFTIFKFSQTLQESSKQQSPVPFVRASSQKRGIGFLQQQAKLQVKQERQKIQKQAIDKCLDSFLNQLAIREEEQINRTQSENQRFQNYSSQHLSRLQRSNTMSYQQSQQCQSQFSQHSQQNYRRRQAQYKTRPAQIQQYQQCQDVLARFRQSEQDKQYQTLKELQTQKLQEIDIFQQRNQQTRFYLLFQQALKSTIFRYNVHKQIDADWLKFERFNYPVQMTSVRRFQLLNKLLEIWLQQEASPELSPILSRKYTQLSNNLVQNLCWTGQQSLRIHQFIPLVYQTRQINQIIQQKKDKALTHNSAKWYHHLALELWSSRQKDHRLIIEKVLVKSDPSHCLWLYALLAEYCNIYDKAMEGETKALDKWAVHNLQKAKAASLTGSVSQQFMLKAQSQQMQKEKQSNISKLFLQFQLGNQYTPKTQIKNGYLRQLISSINSLISQPYRLLQKDQVTSIAEQIIIRKAQNTRLSHHLVQHVLNNEGYYRAIGILHPEKQLFQKMQQLSSRLHLLQLPSLNRYYQ